MSRYTYERPFILEGDWIVCTVTIRPGETASDQNARAARIIRALDLADALDGGPNLDYAADALNLVAAYKAGE